MLYIAENLRKLRKAKDLTQEEVAEMLNVSPQSVSKWERGDTLPDITLLPSLANLHKVSVDAIIGMDKINGRQTKNDVFAICYKHLREGAIDAAIDGFREALKMFPNDEDYLSYYAMSLALVGDSEKLSKAIALCERILDDGVGLKTCHTTRAALCMMYQKAGEKAKAIECARNLPHLRESREIVTAELEKEPSVGEIDAYLRFLAIGESDEQDIIEIALGINMVAVCTECDLLEKIKALREECEAAANCGELRRLPRIRVRDKDGLAPGHIRLRHYADYYIDREYLNPAAATEDIIEALREVAWIR